MILDYGAGNLRSITRACLHLGADVEVTSEPNGLENSKAIILPGVGHWGDAMGKLHEFKGILLEKISEGTPFLGICLGIQTLFEYSEESPTIKGLGIFKGKCIRFHEGLKIPHMGWNNIKIIKKIPILEDIPLDSYFYFVHSYCVDPVDKEIIVATTEYGREFPSIIAKNNVFATQFHPEKSGKVGLKVLRNFLNL